MAAPQLAITNVVTISATPTAPALGPYNTSNLAIFTDEAPNLSSFGSLGYAVYLSPAQVGLDFGTNSVTYQMANAIFSQQPNILNGGGQLVVILLANVVNTLAFSGVAASGTFRVTYNANNSAAINWSDTASQIQTKVQAVSGLSEVLVTGSIASQTLTIQMAGVYNPGAITITSDSLLTAGSASVTVIVTPTTYQTLGSAITAASSKVQFFGVLCNEDIGTVGQSDVLAAAAVVQGLNKILFVVSHTSSDVNPGGSIDLLRSGSFTQTRGLYYGDLTTAINDILMASAYAGRALSTNFSGSNTTSTMHLKQLVGIQPDPTITQTILNLAVTAGADTYVSLQGVPVVFTSGANQFFDQVYNLQWFIGALQVAGFNYLVGANTKIPQTESGMDGLKGAYRAICNQSVVNQYLAPGAWNNATTFGNQQQFLLNIGQTGYYIYSAPVSQQSTADRAARKAPLVQIAAKQAGAVQSSNVIVSVIA